MENTILKKTIIRKFDSYSDFLSHVVKNTDHNGDKYLDHMVQEYLEKTNYKFDKTTNELYDETNEIDLRNILVPGNTYYSPLWGYEIGRAHV